MSRFFPEDWLLLAPSAPGESPSASSVRQMTWFFPEDRHLLAHASEHIELTMLTALARLGARRHPTRAIAEEVLRVAEAVVKLPDQRRIDYASLLHAAASAPFRATLLQFLEVHGMGALELIRNEGKEEGLLEGRVEGRVEGRSAALIRLLRRRGFVVDEALEARIGSTHDVVQLDRWLDRVLDAPSVEDVFSDG